MKQIITTVCILTVGIIHDASSQCLNGQPNLIYNRQTPESVAETSLIYQQPQSPVYQPTLRDVQPLLSSRLREFQPSIPPTTIITDCTPSVCKTLVDIIQLMSVSNLMKDKRGGPDVALQLAEPFFRELISSQALLNPVLTKNISPGAVYPYSNLVLTNPSINPNFVSPFSNPMFTNTISPNFVNPGAVNAISSMFPNFVNSPNIISGLPFPPTMGVSNVNSDALVGNILSMLGNN